MKQRYQFACYSLFLFFFLLISDLSGQTFTNQSSWLNAPVGGYHSGVCMAIADMNGDGLDDIIHLDDGRIMHIKFQNTTHDGFISYNYGLVGSGWSMTVADVDHNGFNDVLIGGYKDDVKVYRTITPGASMVRDDMPGSKFFLQGSNFVDINNDGWLDIFACNDDGDSHKYRNNGTGSFIEDSALIHTLQDPNVEEMNSGNYGSVWTDYDNDGDLDMYLSKCRQGVTSSSDIRRINRLFRQEANGTFTDVASQAGLASGDQSWSADFGDIDNDGDMDMFLVEHTGFCKLFDNNGDGTFTDITAGSGVSLLNGFYGIQCIFRDFDNDGFVDLLVAGNDHYLFHNDGDTDNDQIGEKTFSQLANPFGSGDMESFAVGDINHDGFLDIYGGYANFFNSPSTLPDKLFTNNGNTNNFFCVNLHGVTSNRNGIGARVELWGSWGRQIREVRSGESYGICNSLTQHFGIGAATGIDSLIVKWPSGQKSVAITPATNEFITIMEGAFLPVAWMNFGATPTVAGVELDWATSQEENNQHFVVERSIDGENYEYIGTVTSQGDSDLPQSYSFLDRLPVPGVSYYRIAQVDFDGTSFFSKRIQVTYSIDFTRLAEIYPNPATDRIHAIAQASGPETWYIKVTDLNGRLMVNETQRVEKGIHVLEYNVQDFTSGIYTIHVFEEGGSDKLSKSFIVK